jgi:hypothetical protein
VFLGPLLIVVPVIVIILVVAQARARRDRHRVELQKAILERVGSVKDLAEFLTTEQGERFLSTLSPSHFGRERFRLVSVRVGVVLLTIGVFLMVALHSTVFGDLGDTPPPALWLGMVLLVGQWEAERRIRRPIELMEPFELAAGLAAAVLLLAWSVPSAFEWWPRLAF